MKNAGTDLRHGWRHLPKVLLVVPVTGVIVSGVHLIRRGLEPDPTVVAGSLIEGGAIIVAAGLAFLGGLAAYAAQEDSAQAQRDAADESRRHNETVERAAVQQRLADAVGAAMDLYLAAAECAAHYGGAAARAGHLGFADLRDISAPDTRKDLIDEVLTWRRREPAGFGKGSEAFAVIGERGLQLLIAARSRPSLMNQYIDRLEAEWQNNLATRLAGSGPRLLERATELEAILVELKRHLEKQLPASFPSKSPDASEPHWVYARRPPTDSPPKPSA
jgi:hypothetical protein